RGALRRRRCLSLRQRARGVLRPDRGGVLQTGAGDCVRSDGCPFDDGWRRCALRRQGSDARGGAHRRGRVECLAAGRDCRRTAGRGRTAAGKGLRRNAARLRQPDPVVSSRRRCTGGIRLLGAVRRRATARGTAAVPAGDLPGAAPGGGAVIVNQWVPAAHRGDAIGDSARLVRTLLRAMGHEAELFALDVDDDLKHDVRTFADPAARRGDLTIFHYALPSPMTQAFASLDGGGILQLLNVTPAAYFAPFDPALFRLASLGRRELATLVGRVDLALGDSGDNRREL